MPAPPARGVAHVAGRARADAGCGGSPSRLAPGHARGHRPSRCTQEPQAVPKGSATRRGQGAPGRAQGPGQGRQGGPKVGGQGGRASDPRRQAARRRDRRPGQAGARPAARPPARRAPRPDHAGAPAPGAQAQAAEPPVPRRGDRPALPRQAEGQGRRRRPHCLGASPAGGRPARHLRRGPPGRGPARGQAQAQAGRVPAHGHRLDVLRGGRGWVGRTPPRDSVDPPGRVARWGRRVGQRHAHTRPGVHQPVLRRDEGGRARPGRRCAAQAQRADRGRGRRSGGAVASGGARRGPPRRRGRARPRNLRRGRGASQRAASLRRADQDHRPGDHDPGCVGHVGAPAAVGTELPATRPRPPAGHQDVPQRALRPHRADG